MRLTENYRVDAVGLSLGDMQDETSKKQKKKARYFFVPFFL